MAKHNPFLSAADSARLDSWMVEIASEERGTITVAGDDYRVGDNRALVIHRTATFHDFITGAHGRGGLKLLQHVRKLDPEKALCAAREWLADKGTFGRLIPSSDGEDAAQAGDDAQRQAFIDTVWAAATPAASSTTAKAYLASRGLTVSAADMAQLRWVENARGSDGALVVPSTDNNGGLVAIQETFISPDGSKSVSGCAGMAARITHRGPHDWSRKGLVRFGDDENPRLYLTEGTEDALSVRMAVPEPVVVTLGVAAIGKAKLPLGVKEIVVVRDGDMAGSPSDERLWRGVARLMGQGVDVLITQRPTRVFGKQSILKDANDVLQAHGAAGVQRLIDTASDKPDELDSGVFLDELSRLSNTEYEVARAQAAKKAGMRFGTLDVERSERRKLRAVEGADDTVGPDDLPWPDPITHIGEVLDAAVTEIGKYLIAEPTLHDAMVLWGCSAHLLSREDLDIHIAPRFAFQAPGKDCGKTTALNLLWGLSPRAELYSSASTASIFRMIHETHPTLLLDEADNQLNKRDGGADLKAILNSGHYRPTAYVARMEADADGGWHRVRFNTFTGIAFAGIGTLPDTLQSRSIVGYLQRAKPSEKRERLRHGRTDPLIECRRKFARWALDLCHLPEVPMTEEFANRLGDNWENLFRIAQAAGGEWPARALAATRAAIAGAPADTSEIIAVLNAVWTVFYEKVVTRMHTDGLVAAMIALDEGQWTRANGGRQIDAYYLKEHLSPVITVNTSALKKARRWREGKGNTKHGYTEDHLAEAFTRYLNRGLPSKAERVEDIPSQAGPTSSDPSGPFNARTKNGTTLDGYSATDSGPDTQTASDAFSDMDSAPDERFASDAKKSEQDSAVDGKASDASDALDEIGRVRKHMPVGAKRRRTNRPINGPQCAEKR